MLAQNHIRSALQKLAATAGALLAAMLLAGAASGQMAAIAAVDEPEAAAEARGSAAASGGGKQAGGKTGAKGGSSGRKTSGSTKKPKTSTAMRPSPPPPPPAAFNGPVLGDKFTFLNYEVVTAEKPYHTRAAKANGAKGLVQVEVLVSTDGSVLSAKARTGNKELWPEAERAALASKFNRPTADGRPARAMGFLVYRFGPADD